MTNDMPIDLRSLGDVDSPEILHDALRRFRRRAVRNVAWVVIAALALGIFLVSVRAQRGVAAEIRSAPGHSPGTIYELDGVTTILVKVADLGDQIGIDLLIAQPQGAEPRSTGRDIYQTLIFADGPIEFATDGDYYQDGAYHVYQKMNAPKDGRITVEVQQQCAPPSGSGSCHILIRPGMTSLEQKFVIDLREAGVPESIWQKR